MKRVVFGAICATLLWSANVAGGGETAADRGWDIYGKNCSPCHGMTGNGDGLEAWMIGFEARDLRAGTFKYRSTVSGSRPTAADLERTMARGVPMTFMPHHRDMSAEDLRIVAKYLEGAFMKGRPLTEPVEIPEPPGSLGSPGSLARGAHLYDLLQCGVCHASRRGTSGRPSSSFDPDAWGRPQHPPNLAALIFKSGPGPEDVYRTVLTGLDGTAMPAFADALEPGCAVRQGDGWHLVSYIMSLRSVPAESRRKTPRFSYESLLP